ncbi:hypothetical protein [Alicyclobacillus sp. SO9]|uniref:hypothetical protein n=1 Tax=Alicyclobacillus sp. SO9 TaxID=2665646 RepID=UPI0018E779F5|nr:hypothetical protein [Alicyclobacillus sp. SO9]QQE81599.1 hypothetical protein GI364_24715 [Alicyclobacillus sp. SO9]
MEVQAHALYRALKSLAPVPKTFEIEEITEYTDTLTGKVTRKKKRRKYPVIVVKFDGHEMTVEYYSLRSVIKTLGKKTIRIYSRGQFLDVDYQSGSLSLVPLEATSDMVFNLKTLSVEQAKEVV